MAPIVISSMVQLFDVVTPFNAFSKLDTFVQRRDNVLPDSRWEHECLSRNGRFLNITFFPMVVGSAPGKSRYGAVVYSSEPLEFGPAFKVHTRSITCESCQFHFSRGRNYIDFDEHSFKKMASMCCPWQGSYAYIVCGNAVDMIVGRSWYFAFYAAVSGLPAFFYTGCGFEVSHGNLDIVESALITTKYRGVVKCGGALVCGRYPDLDPSQYSDTPDYDLMMCDDIHDLGKRLAVLLRARGNYFGVTKRTPWKTFFSLPPPFLRFDLVRENQALCEVLYYYYRRVPEHLRVQLLAVIFRVLGSPIGASLVESLVQFLKARFSNFSSSESCFFGSTLDGFVTSFLPTQSVSLLLGALLDGVYSSVESMF